MHWGHPMVKWCIMAQLWEPLVGKNFARNGIQPLLITPKIVSLLYDPTSTIPRLTLVRMGRIFLLTQVLVVSLLLALHVQQAVTFPELAHPYRARGYLFRLAVLHQCVTNTDAATGHSRQTGRAWPSVAAWGRKGRISNAVDPGRIRVDTEKTLNIRRAWRYNVPISCGDFQCTQCILWFSSVPSVYPMCNPTVPVILPGSVQTPHGAVQGQRMAITFSL